jgi:hypothetical protein
VDARWEALAVLGAFGAAAIPKFMSALLTQSRKSCAEVLAVGENAVTTLVSCVERSVPQQRVYFAEA